MKPLTQRVRFDFFLGPPNGLSFFGPVVGIGRFGLSNWSVRSGHWRGLRLPLGQVAVAQKTSTKMEPWQVETWTNTCGLPLLVNFEPHPSGFRPQCEPKERCRLRLIELRTTLRRQLFSGSHYFSFFLVADPLKWSFQNRVPCFFPGSLNNGGLDRELSH